MLSSSLFVFEPALRHRHRAMAGKDRVDRGHVVRGYVPAQCPEVFLNLGGLAEAHQRRADHWIARGPAQRELRQCLAILGRQSFEFLDGSQIAREMVWAKEIAKQIEA